MCHRGFVQLTGHLCKLKKDCVGGSKKKELRKGKMKKRIKERDIEEEGH